VFLVAIMIMSVFAVPIAFSGAAAATADDGSLTFNDQALDGTTVIVEDAQASDGNGATDATVVITYTDGDSVIVAGVEEFDGTPQDVTVTIGDTGNFPGEHTAHIVPDSEVAGVNVGEDISEAIADRDVAPLANENANVYIGEDTDAAAINNENIANVLGVDRAVDAFDLNEQAFWQGQEVAVYNLTPGGQDVQLREKTGDSSSSLRDELSTDDLGIVTFESDNRNEGEYFLRGADAGVPANGINNQLFEIVEQDLTAEFDDDEVADAGVNSVTEIEIDSNRGTYSLNVSADGLDAGDLFDIFNATGDFTDDDGAVGNNGPFLIEADDDEDVLTIFSVRDGEYEVDFEDVEEGDYEFEFEVTDSTASATASITVVDSGDGSLSVEDAEQSTGDIAEIVVSASNTDEGNLIIGNEDDSNYQANVSIDFGDLDQVTVYFNTYAAGNSDFGEVVWLDDDDLDEGASIELEYETDDIDGILDIGDYEMTVSANTDFSETIDNPDDVASLFIEERSTDDLNIWTAADVSVEDILDEDDDDQLAAVVTAIENDLITPADTIAHDDFVVHQLEASGLKGLFKYAESETGAETLGEQFIELATNETLAADLEADTIIQLRVRETRDSVGPNAQRDSIDFTETDVTVLHDEDGDQYFILLNTDEIELVNGEIEKDEDYEFDIRFELRDERLLDVDEDDDDLEVVDYYQQLNTAFELVERDGSFDLTDDDMIEVEAGEEQLITGTTNVAPGSEVQIRIRGTGDARFSKSQSEIVVDADGNFAGEFDFSDRNVDDEFTATLRNVVTEDDNPQEDGIVVESVDEVDDDDMDDMDDADDEPADDHDDMDDDAAADDDEEQVDETEDDTPGFGAIVALLAVLGAAFLATRRQN